MIIHLEECDPEGKGWAEKGFRGLLEQGAEMCPKVEYMREELYPDEIVWVESKPTWALMMQKARAMEQEAHTLGQEAANARCPVEDSGGARCTADATPEHAHRYRVEDLP